MNHTMNQNKKCITAIIIVKHFIMLFALQAFSYPLNKCSGFLDWI